MLLPPHCHECETRIAQLDLHGNAEAAAKALGMTIPPQLARAVPKRRLEFLAGRLSAHRALERAGYKGGAEIAIGQWRAPVWPLGFTGSIAHAHGSAWAVVGPRHIYRGIGIDLEEIVMPATARDLSATVLRAEERERARPARLSDEQLLSLVFSAKESLYKCLQPITLARFGFLDAELVHLHPQSGLLRLSLRAALSAEFQPGIAFDVSFELGTRTRTAMFLPAAA